MDLALSLTERQVSAGIEVAATVVLDAATLRQSMHVISETTFYVVWVASSLTPRVLSSNLHTLQC